MDQKSQLPYLPYPVGGGNGPPPTYAYPLQQGPYFPPSEQFGKPETSTSYPSPPQVAVPPVGFYLPPSSSQSQPINMSNDEEPKFTPFHDEIEGFAFSDKSIRMAFIRKVFAILSVQMAVTTAFIGLFLYHDGIKNWAAKNLWFLFLMLAVYIVTAISLLCFEGLRRKAPGNYIFLGIFTFATAILVGMTASRFKEESVILAAGVTVVVCVSLMIFALQTKIDFTRFGGILFVLLIVLILFGFLTIFLPRSAFPISRMIYSGLGAILFSAFLVHDVQLLVGGDHKYRLSPEEYVFAAMTIFLDVINIFLYLLQLFGQKN